MTVGDPEAGPRKPAVPTKKAAPRRTSGNRAAPAPRRSGPADPANNPVGYFGANPNNKDNGDYIGSPSMPGFILGQQSYDANGTLNALSPAEYRTWLNGIQQNPVFAALRSQFGDAYVAYEWFAYRTQPDDANYYNSLSAKFPGYENYIPTAGGGGRGGGRGGGGGGGGGMTKEQQYSAAAAAIRNQSDTYGMTLNDDEVNAIAHTVVEDNWSGDQLTDYLLGATPGITKAGTFQSTTEQIKSMAGNQLVTVSDDTAKDWAKRILSGEMAMDTVNMILVQQATSEFGWAADALKTGATMRDVLSPARDTVARELEMSPAQIDLMDPRWRKMVQTTNDDGTPRGATLTEAVSAARKDQAYASTAGAARLGAQTATILRNVFEG